MRPKSILWLWIFIALAVGFGLGLTYAWIIAPVQYVDAVPASLRADFKDHYRSSIAAAFASTHDMERARARLTLLDDPDPAQALAAQAQRMVANGASIETIQQVADLASALQGQASISPAMTQTTTPAPPSLNSPTVAIPETEISPTVFDTEPANSPSPVITSTPAPTRTPTPTAGAPYLFIGQDVVCNPNLTEGVLQIVVTNASRRQIPGAEIIVTWNNGEEHIFTGIKPELGNGYADYLMTPDITYTVRMADGGTPATDLSTPDCMSSDGNAYFGGIRITFQQP